MQTANHLTAAVSESVEYHLTQRVSEVGVTRIRGGGVPAGDNK